MFIYTYTHTHVYIFHRQTHTYVRIHIHAMGYYTDVNTCVLQAQDPWGSSAISSYNTWMPSAHTSSVGGWAGSDAHQAAANLSQVKRLLIAVPVRSAMLVLAAVSVLSAVLVLSANVIPDILVLCVCFTVQVYLEHH
jgi:hypothetical protein